MSHFYGTVIGRGQTKGTRAGTKASGIVTHAAGWDRAVRVELSVDEDGHNVATVELVRWKGSGVRRELWNGRIDGG